MLLRFDVREAKVQEFTLSQQLKLEEKRLEDKLRSNSQRQKTLKRNIDLTEKILNKLRPLERDGAISELQILQQSNRLETQLDEQIQLETNREELINDSESRRTQLSGQLKQVRNRLRNEIVKAPISGTVFELQPDNNRYVTTNAERLLKIVPNGELGGEVSIGNQDIGFIRAGQPVKVRVDSFPSQNTEK